MTTDFWSRRKARVRAEEQAETRARDKAAEDDAAAELADLPDEEILERLGLPDPDNLGLGDDFRAFMARQVPEHLRRRALRRLWTSNPVLACLDGLNDYDDDYRVARATGPAVKSAYRIGRGFVDMARPVPPAPQAATAVVEDQEPAMYDSDAPETEDRVATVEPDPVDPTPTPRRMRFAFPDYDEQERA